MAWRPRNADIEVVPVVLGASWPGLAYVPEHSTAEIGVHLFVRVHDSSPRLLRVAGVGLAARARAAVFACCLTLALQTGPPEAIGVALQALRCTGLTLTRRRTRTRQTHLLALLAAGGCYEWVVHHCVWFTGFSPWTNCRAIVVCAPLAIQCVPDRVCAVWPARWPIGCCLPAWGPITSALQHVT